MIITDVVLKNFQAHKNLHLKFTNGVNIIRGRSDVGKSAIIRAIISCITGKGFSTSFQTWGTSGPMEVTLKTEDHEVTRGRNGKENYYIVDGKKFSALNRMLPKEVVDALPISDSHFGKQFGGIYLLSSSPAEVAKVIQSVVDLDSIARITKLANEQIRTTGTEETLLQRELDSVVSDLKPYANLSELRKRFDQLVIQDEVCRERREEIKSYRAILDGYAKLETYAKKAVAASFRHDFEECKALYASIEKRRLEAAQMRKLLKRLKRYQENVSRLDEVKEILAQFLELKTEIDTHLNRRRDYCEKKHLVFFYKQTLEQYKEVFSKLEQGNLELVKLKKQLKICPTCGRSFHE